MTKSCSHRSLNRNLDEFETINVKRLGEDIRAFSRFSNEKIILTQEIEKIIEPKRFHSVLDVGCGEGYVIRKIYRKVNRCVALDPDHEMLEILKKYVHDNSRVIFINKKLEEFETTERFDVILSSHTLSFFNDKQKAINRMLDYTRKDGKLIIILHCNASEQLWMLREMFHLINRREINHIYAEALHEYLAKKGLDPKLERVETVAVFPSLEIPLKLSYFLFRTDYNKTSSQNRLSIRRYLETKMYNHSVQIRTLHGIISLRKT